jgi:hypothetical protein
LGTDINRPYITIACLKGRISSINVANLFDDCQEIIVVFHPLRPEVLIWASFNQQHNLAAAYVSIQERELIRREFFYLQRL